MTKLSNLLSVNHSFDCYLEFSKFFFFALKKRLKKIKKNGINPSTKTFFKNFFIGNEKMSKIKNLFEASVNVFVGKLQEVLERFLA